MKLLKQTAALMCALILCVQMAPSAAAAQNTGFSDVAANAWYADAVAYCQDNGLMSGTSAATFSPNSTMTRAMLAATLYRMAGSPMPTQAAAFTDVEAGVWYANAVSWAVERGIAGGYGNGSFGVGDPVSREQMAVMLWRYAEKPDASGETGFVDNADISSAMRSAVSWTRENGIIGGVGENWFDPKSSATRAQVAVILSRYSQALTAQEPETPPSDTSTTNALGGMTPEDALEYMKNTPDLVIVDVAATRWYSEKHFEGAINIPIEELDSTEEDALYMELPTGRPVLVHCRRGAIAPGAYQHLKELRPDIPEISYIAGTPPFDEYNGWLAAPK